MATPQFSATDHFEFKKWATERRDSLKQLAQTLNDALDNDAVERSVLMEETVRAEGELSEVRNALTQLPPNLAEALREYTDRYVDKVARVVQKANQRLQKQS